MPKSRTSQRRGPTPPRTPKANSAPGPQVQRAAELGYIATVAAGADGCSCRACEALREQSRVMLDQYDKERSANGPSDGS